MRAHEIGVDTSAPKLNFGYCSCGWTGPWRRWIWRARADAEIHEDSKEPWTECGCGVRGCVWGHGA